MDIDQKTTITHPTTAESLVNLNGKWTFEFKTPRGDRKYETMLNQKGSVATGKFKDKPLKIYVAGDKVSFTTKRSVVVGTMTMNYQGKVKGNKMTGTYKVVKGFMAGDKEYEWSAVKKK